jgi:hypothetical protein
MIEPTVGRIVLYHPHVDEKEHLTAPPAPGAPLAAMIAGVESPRIINLLVADAHGNPFGRAGVFLVQDGETPPTDISYAEWMAYQKGQAAKTEKLETQISGAGDKPAAAELTGRLANFQAADPAANPPGSAPQPNADPVGQSAADVAGAAPQDQAQA